MTAECSIQLRDYELLKKKLFSTEKILEYFSGRIKILKNSGINLLREHESRAVSLTVNIV